MEADALQAQMLSRASSQDWYIQHTTGVNAGPLYTARMAQVGLGIMETASNSPIAATGSASEDDSVILMMSGEVYNVKELLSFLAIHGVKPRNDAHAELLLQGYLLKRDMHFFRQINGRFHAVILDRREKKVILTCDRFGTRPLYWSASSHGLSYAAEIYTMLADDTISRRVSTPALTDFFTYGHYLHDYTSLEDVRVLPPAAWYTFHLGDELKLEKKFYWEINIARIQNEEKISEKMGFSTDEFSIMAVQLAFCESVMHQAYTHNRGSLGLSLSGGLDARSILAALTGGDSFLNPEDITTVALGMPGSADHLLASQLAKRAGTRHLNYKLGTLFLQDYLTHMKNMVALTDGQYLSSCIVMPTLPFYRDQGIRILMRGHAGEMMHLSKAYAFSITSSELRGIRDEQSLANWAFSHLQAYMMNGVKGPLLKNVSKDCFTNMGRESLMRTLENVKDTQPPAQRLWQLFLRLRVHREISLSLRKFESQVIVRLPFLDNRLMNLLLGIDTQLKMGETLEKYILLHTRRDFLKVKNVNTGTYIGAGYCRQACAHFIHRVYAKLGVPGYQPYERMGLWLRRELKHTVSQVLLGDALDRGIFEPDTVRNIIQEHNDGANHTYLILALMICELGMQRLA